MDPRLIKLSRRINNEEEQIINVSNRLEEDRRNVRRLDKEMYRQEQYADQQHFFNENIERNHNINIAIFVLLGIVILVVLIIAALAYHKSFNAGFPENSIDASELVNNDDYTMKNLKLTGGGNGTLTIQTPGGITFGASQITADEFRVIDGAIAGTIISNKAVVVDSNKNVNGLNFLTAGGASFSSGVCFQSLITANAGMSVKGGVSFTNLVRFYDGMIVTGGTSFNNRVNFYDGMSVNSVLYSYGGLSVSGTTNFSNLITVESDTGISIQGGISMSSAINMYSQLNSTSGICILGGLSVSGTTDLYGTTRIAKTVSLDTTSLTNVSTFYDLSLNESGYEIYVDYTNKENILFNLPTATTGHNYKFIWTEGPSVGDKFSFQLSSNNTISGSVFIKEKTTNNLNVLTSDSSDNNYFLNLNSMILDGSVLNVKNNNGNWLINGNIGISATPTALDSFYNNNYKKWIIGGTGKVNLMFSDNGLNYSSVYNEPELLKTNSAHVFGSAFGYDGSGASLYVAACSSVNSDTQNIMYSNNGTSWQFATGTQFLNRANVPQGRRVAYGLNNLGNKHWVAVGNGDTSDRYNNILFSNTGTCWMQSHSNGLSFSTSADDVAYGLQSDGTCIWVAVGTNISASRTIMWSTDGMCWAQSVASGESFNNFGSAVAFGTDNLGNYLWVAGGSNSSDDYKRLLWSTDGMCWAKSSSVGEKSTLNISSISYGLSSNGACTWIACAAGEPSGAIFISKDGMSWFRASNDTYNLASKLVYNARYGLSSNGTGLWVATVFGLNTSYNNLIYSVNTRDWFPVNNGSMLAGMRPVLYSAPLYPNVGNLIDDVYT